MHLPAKPRVTAELIQHLRDIHPNQCPHINMTDRDIWIAVGSHQVVAYLEALLKQQQEADDFEDED